MEWCYSTHLLWLSQNWVHNFKLIEIFSYSHWVKSINSNINIHLLKSFIKSFNLMRSRPINSLVIMIHYNYKICLDWPILRTIWKSKELSNELIMRTVDLCQLEHFWTANSKIISSNYLSKYKLLRCLTTLSSSGRRLKRSASDWENRIFNTNRICSCPHREGKWFLEKSFLDKQDNDCVVVDNEQVV